MKRLGLKEEIISNLNWDLVFGRERKGILIGVGVGRKKAT